MGKTKGQRIKGNVQPASSSRAAEILASSSSQLPTANLGGFAQFVGGTPFAPNPPAVGDSTTDSMAGSNMDPELVLIFKKLSKRDTTTKLKALEDLEAYLRKNEEDDFGSNGLIGVWSRLYIRLALDIERRVRYATGTCHLLIASKAKKRLAPHLKEIIAVWIISLFDQSKDVSRIATEAFETVFLEEKRIEVLQFCQSEIVDFIIDVILHKAPETLSDPRFISKEDMAAKYARVVSSSYYALSFLIDRLNESALSKCQQQYNALFDNTRTWTNLSCESSLIRKSCYHLIKTLTVKWPIIIEERLESLSTTYLSKVFSDKDTSIHSELWESLLIFTKAFPQSWMIASKKKPMLPKLYAFLRAGGYGSISVTYPSLLVLVDSLPSQIIAARPKFYDEFFGDFWKGLSGTVIDHTNSGTFISAYCECLVYFIVKLSKTYNEADILKTLIEEKFFGIVELYLVDSKSSGKFRTNQLCSAVASNIMKLITGTHTRDAATTLFGKIEYLFNVNINRSSLDGNKELDFSVYFSEVCQRLADLLSCINTKTIEVGNDRTDAHLIVYDFIEKIFILALSKSTETSEKLLGLSLIISRLIKSFPQVTFERQLTKDAIDTFISDDFHKLVINAPEPVLDHLFDIFLLYLAQCDDKQSLQIWNALVDVIIQLNDRTRKLNCFLLAIDKTNGMKLRQTLYNDKLAAFVIKVSTELEDGEDTLLAEYERVIISSLKSDVCIISKQTRQSILDRVSMVLANSSKIHYTSEDIPSSTKSTTISILRICNALLNTDQNFIKFLFEFNYASIIAYIYELSFMKAHGQLDEGYVNTVVELSKSSWKLACQALEQKEMLGDIICENVFLSLLDIRYASSPLDFTHRLTTLIADLFDNEHFYKQRFVEKLLINNQQWRDISLPFVSLPVDSTLAILYDSIAVTPTTATASDRMPIKAIQYDIYGLSLYGRVGLFMIDIINSIGVSEFFFGQDLKETYTATSRHFVILELLLMHILSDVYGAHIQSPHVWDATSVERSNFHGFKTFLEEVNSIAIEYVNRQNQHMQFSIKNLIGRLITGEHNEPDASVNLNTLLIESTSRSKGEKGHYWNRVSERLCQIILKESNVQTIEAEEFIDALMSDVCKVSADTKIAFILSLKSILNLSSRFKTLQCDIAERLNEMEAADIFDNNSDESNGHTLLSLLVATTKKSDTYFLRPDDALTLINTFRKWYENYGTTSQYINAQISIARLLYLIVDTVQESPGLHWEFVFTRIENWLQNDEDLVLRYEAINLFNRLSVLSAAASKFSADIEDESAAQSEITLSDALHKHQPTISNCLLGYLLQERAHANTIFSKQYSAYLNILSEACYNIPRSVIREKSTELYELLDISHEVVQKCTYLLLRDIIIEAVARRSEQMEINEIAGVNSRVPVEAKIDEALVSLIKQGHESDLIKVLSGNREILSVHRTFSYLLSALLLFDHFRNATYKYKSQFITLLKELDILSGFLPFIFQALGLVSPSTPYDLSKWDVTEFYVEAFEIDLFEDLGFPLLSAHIYHLSLVHVPSLVRNWWTYCKKRQLTIAVDSYTEKYFSPIIIKQQLDNLQREDVKSQLQDDKFSIRISRGTNEVIAVVNIDESVTELSLRMPGSFPLKLVEVGRAERMGMATVKDLVWGRLPVETLVNSQDGNLEAALSIFKRNIESHLEGIDDCVVCYSVVSYVDRSLPNKTCSTCKNKFHAACLYKWFRTSNSTSCPLCRRLF